MDKILTVPEIAEYLRVSRTTVWRWCNEGKLPAFKVGRHWRVHRSEFEKLVGQTFGEQHEPETANVKRQG
jgi:excisionase family DNA binding protein